MRTLTIQEVNTIEKLFQLNQNSLLKTMNHYLKNKYNNVIATKDYIIAVGDIPVGIVAHADTVFKKPPQRIFYDERKNVMWSPEGLGADDRAGIFAIIQILKTGLRPTIIITADEEMGGLGASSLIRAFKKSPTELKYLIQLDRRDGIDCVFYDCDNPKFEEYVESFGFVTNFGSFSDISILCPIWKIAGVNLSIGYQDEHSYSETLYIGHMFNTINKVIKMLNDAETAEKFDYIKSKKKKWYSYYPNEDDDIDYGWDPSYGVSKEDWYSFMAPQYKCKICGEYDYEYNMFPVVTQEGGLIYMCSDCVSENPEVEWCMECGNPFLLPKNNKKETHCKNCKEKVKDDTSRRSQKNKK